MSAQQTARRPRLEADGRTAALHMRFAGGLQNSYPVDAAIACRGCSPVASRASWRPATQPASMGDRDTRSSDLYPCRNPALEPGTILVYTAAQRLINVKIKSNDFSTTVSTLTETIPKNCY